MQNDSELHRKYLPNLAHKVPQNVSTVFQLIKMKKAELSRHLEDISGSQQALPHIYHEKQERIRIEKPQINISYQDQSDKDDLQSRSSRGATPSNYKYKTILDQIENEEKKSQHASRADNLLSRSKKDSRIVSSDLKSLDTKGKFRTKTEVKQFQTRKQTNTSHISNSIQKVKEEDNRVKVMEDAKKQFCLSIETIPKNMKMRNQDNLTETVTNLEIFNPFFNRNQRIVNICLLKMGKILLRDSPTQLYKAGEQLEHFYIIMLGKVKIAEGSNKRVCQTGETVLQQVMFSEKAKKLSLQRAKVIGPTYLLQLKIEQYQKMKQQLIRYGLRLGFQEMQTIIKRNYIIKNWMRNKRKKDGSK